MLDSQLRDKYLEYKYTTSSSLDGGGAATFLYTSSLPSAFLAASTCGVFDRRMLHQMLLNCETNYGRDGPREAKILLWGELMFSL